MKVKMPKCVNYRKCGRQAKGPHARFCTPCFVANAKLKGSDSSGNSSASGNPGNAGNVKKGKVKKDAGKRSGLRRSAKKTWELRGNSTSKRGWVNFAESNAGGKRMPVAGQQAASIAG